MDLNRLEEKWGTLLKYPHYWANGEMPFISEDARLNVIFEKCDNSLVVEYFERLNAPIHPELQEFYMSYNGCRLFFGSLSIFGIASNKTDVYLPFDLYRENINNIAKLSVRDRKRCKYVFFGSLGGDYLFSYRKDELSKVYCMKPGSLKVVCEYDSFSTFWNHFFEGLMDEYNELCYKIHPNEADKGIPALENVTYKLF